LVCSLPTDTTMKIWVMMINGREEAQQCAQFACVDAARD
jgi:hypothetical protein